MAGRIYAGAGHYATKGKHFQGGLFRTEPGNRDWKPLTRGLPEQVETRAFAVHPKDANVLYAGTQDGPYRTVNGGTVGARDFPAGAVVGRLASTHAPNVLCGTARWVVYRSEDSGENWDSCRNRPSMRYGVQTP